MFNWIKKRTNKKIPSSEIEFNTNNNEKSIIASERKHEQQVYEHVEYLRENGFSDSAEQILKYQKNQKIQESYRGLFSKAEQLSKHGELLESNDILLNLLRKKPNPDFPASIFWRLAINYRKLKNYSSEKKYIEIFIKDYQSIYGSDMWLGKFNLRLEKVTNLINQSNNVD